MDLNSFYNILETFGFVQNICTYSTHRSHHLLDYIITRKGCNTSDFLVSDFISDHGALHASLQCIRPHLFGNRYQSEQLIVKDLDKFSIDQRCADVDTMVEMYRFLLELLDKHAPPKKYNGCG